MSRYLFSTYQINLVLRGVCLLAMSKFMLRKSLCKPKHRMLLFLSMFGAYLGKLETFHASVLFEMCLFCVTFLRYWSCCWCLQEQYQLLGAWKNDISVQIEAQAVWQYLRVLLWQPSYSPTLWGKHSFNLPDLQLLNFLESFKIFTFLSSWSCFRWIGGTLFESRERKHTYEDLWWLSHVLSRSRWNHKSHYYSKFASCVSFDKKISGKWVVE